MAPNVKDLGYWEAYTPDELPSWVKDVPVGMKVLFSRRKSDGVDWYNFRSAEGSFTEGFLLASASLHPDTSQEVMQAIVRNRDDFAVPFALHVIEIEDLAPDNVTPWKDYEQRVLDPATLTIGNLWQPPVMAVRDYQFAGQAAAEGIISDDDALDWITVGKTPDRLISAVKANVTDLDRQKRVLLFLAGTTSFPRYHELTPLLAASFGKDTPEKLTAFFLAASQR